MLIHLSITNFALIDKIDLDLKDNLSAITGETGAGKSILLGALGLILGKRADHSTLKDTSKKCIIEGTFNLKNYNLKSLFESFDLDYLDETIIRREINGAGKSRSFINDTPCTLDILKEIGSFLIDIHSQQQSLQINDSNFQLGVIDSIAKNSKLLTEYQSKFRDYRKLQREVEIAVNEAAELAKEQDFLNFQFSELESLNLKLGEGEDLEKEQNRFANSEEVISSINQIKHLLEEDENNVISQTNRVKQLLQSIQRYDEDSVSLLERVNSVYLELQDINVEMEEKLDKFEYNPERQQIVEDRLLEIHRLQNKHQLGSAEELIDLQSELENKLLSIQNSDSNIDLQKIELQQRKEQLTILASKLTEKRLGVLENIEKKVIKTLQSLGISHASLKIDHESEKTFTASGLDKFTFLFSANKGVEPALVSKTASGGESSRLMLAIKELVAEHQQLPTILFDEIDTGVSGEVAEKMGQILSRMGGKRQVIAITHLPQIAAKGQQHYFVFKDNSANRSVSQIKELSQEERVGEIAKMLSGSKLTEASLNNAKELLYQ